MFAKDKKNLEIQAFTNELQIDNIANLTLRTQECNPIKVNNANQPTIQIKIIIPVTTKASSSYQ